MALASGRAVGIEVTIYNPALDEDGKAGRDLTRVYGQCAWYISAIDLITTLVCHTVFTSR